MSESTKRRLIETAATLQRHSHKEWAEFHAALVDYADNIVTQCINSSIPMLPTIQGRAQAVTELVTWLSEPAAASDKLDKRHHNG